MSLIGRERELNELARLLDRASAGSGGLLVVLGAAGSGKSTFADAAVAEARGRGFEVVRTSPALGQVGRLVWAQILADLGAADSVIASLLAKASPLDLDRAAQQLSSRSNCLVVVDDVDRGGRQALELLAVVAGRLVGGTTAILVTAGSPLGLGQEVRLGGLSEPELASVYAEVPAKARHALWLASRGSPGVARSLAAELTGLARDVDPVVHLALNAPSTSEFLAIDPALCALIEAATGRTTDDASRARLLARLAHEMLADASAAPRRRALVDQALELARAVGEPGILAEVLDARLHALWDPAGAEARLSASAEIVELARTVGDDNRERHGMFWRFVALMELGRVAEAESALGAYERAAETAGDSAGLVMALARHGMLASLRGNFDEASRVADKVADQARRAGMPDGDRLTAALRGMIAAERDPESWPAAVEMFRALSRRLPGHFMEAMAARLLAVAGKTSEADMELQRVLPRVLAGSGPRWLGATADLAAAAAGTGNEIAAAQLYEVLLPYRGRLVVWAGANTVTGSVAYYLGLLAAALGKPDDAMDYFDEAIATAQRFGALPWVAHGLVEYADALVARSAPGDADRAEAYRHRARTIAEQLGMSVLLLSMSRPPDEWSMSRDGTDWLLEAGEERARLPDSRGLHYLRALLAAPGREISALDLAAGGAGLVAPREPAVLDAAARDSYRQRLEALAAELDAADRTGESARADRVEAERQAVLDELRRARGLGGRSRAISVEGERARVNVTRTLRATIERISAAAPRAGAHLDGSLRTGRMCRYDPTPGGPSRWSV
jgi:tetratricopeptide (TPR) repeat protein